MTGSGIYAVLWKEIFPQISAVADLGNITLPDLANVNSILAALVFAEFTLILFYLLERKWRQRANKIE